MEVPTNLHFGRAQDHTMADSLVDLGIQDALRYVNLDIIPSVVTVVRDVMMILVTSLTCVSATPQTEFPTIRPTDISDQPPRPSSQIFFAYTLAKTETLLAALWTLAKCGTALGAFQLVWTHFVDPFIHSSTKALTESSSGRGAGAFDRARRREDPLAHKRATRTASTKTNLAVGSPGRGGLARTRSDVPDAAAGLAAASSPVAPRGLALDELRDGATVCIELRGAGSGSSSDGWSEGFLCVHPYRTYETAGMMGALNWGGHQMTVTPRARVESMCTDAHGGHQADHENDAARFLFRVHLFGTGCDITLRSESTGTLLTTFLRGVKFDRRRVVAWHKQRSSKLLTAASAMFAPPEGGALEEWALHPVRRTPDGLVSDEFANCGEENEPPNGVPSSAAEYALCRPRDGTFWAYNVYGDEMMAFTKDLAEASLFRIHRAFTDKKWD